MVFIFEKSKTQKRRRSKKKIRFFITFPHFNNSMPPDIFMLNTW